MKRKVKRQVKQGMAVFLSATMALSDVGIGSLYAAEADPSVKTVIDYEESEKKNLLKKQLAETDSEENAEEIVLEKAEKEDKKTKEKTEEKAKEEAAEEDLAEEETEKEAAEEDLTEEENGTEEEVLEEDLVGDEEDEEVLEEDLIEDEEEEEVLEEGRIEDADEEEEEVLEEDSVADEEEKEVLEEDLTADGEKEEVLEEDLTEDKKEEEVLEEDLTADEKKEAAEEDLAEETKAGESKEETFEEKTEKQEENLTVQEIKADTTKQETAEETVMDTVLWNQAQLFQAALIAEEELGTTLTAEEGDYRITVTAKEAVFPANAVLDVTQVNDSETMSELEKALRELEEDETISEEELACFDLAVLDGDGDELELDSSRVKVTIELLAAKSDEEMEYQIYQADQDSKKVTKKTTALILDMPELAVEAEIDSMGRVVLRMNEVGEVAEGARAESVNVTTEAELKGALQLESTTIINVISDITFSDTAITMAANQILNIAEGTTLTITKRVNAGKMLTFTGSGTVSIEVAGEGLRGRIAVGEANKENSVKVVVEQNSFIYPNGEITIRKGATLQVKSSEGIKLDNGKKLTVEEGGNFLGETGSGITLVAGAQVADVTNAFSDQEKSFNSSTFITVGAEGDAAADNQLTDGYYVWDETKQCFSKEKIDPAAWLKEQLEADNTQGSTITVTDDITFDAEAAMTANKILEIAEGKTLTLTGKIQTQKARLTIIGKGIVKMQGNGSLDGRVYVGLENKANNSHVILEGTSKISNGNFYVSQGATVEVNSTEGINIGSGKSLTIESGGTLTGGGGGTIVLTAGATVTGAGSVFEDQEKAFTTNWMQRKKTS